MKSTYLFKSYLAETNNKNKSKKGHNPVKIWRMITKTCIL